MNWKNGSYIYIYTLFYNRCGKDSSPPDCMRLRDLFVGKEVLGSRSLGRKELTLKRQALFRFDF